jgi:uncharacterized protein YqhQ
MVFNFRYKETTDPIIFVIHVLILSIILCRYFFLIIPKFLKNIIIHIKLKKLARAIRTSSNIFLHKSLIGIEHI